MVSNGSTRLIRDLESQIAGALGDLCGESYVAELFDSVQYVMAGGGKYVRPVLLLLVARVFEVTTASAMPAALAVELIHNFSLVHDDIMDHSASRRGRTTVHIRWDGDTAILCGDVMLGMSFAMVTRASPSHASSSVQCLSEAVTALCEGQALDKAFECRSTTVAEYIDMIDRKTGALLAASLEIGGILGDASDNQRIVLRNIGMEAGRAFQIQDDLLDLVASDERWGKPVGGDLMEGKKTYILLQAMERASGDDFAFFSGIRRGAGLRLDQIAEARSRMEDLGVISHARERVMHHSERAIAHVRSLPDTTVTAKLVHLLARLAGRQR